MTSKQTSTIQSAIITLLVCFTAWQAYSIHKLNGKISDLRESLEISSQVRIQYVAEKMSGLADVDQRFRNHEFANEISLLRFSESTNDIIATISNTAKRIRYENEMKYTFFAKDIESQITSMRKMITLMMTKLTDKERRLKEIEDFLARVRK